MSSILFKIPKVRLMMVNASNSKGERCIYVVVPFSAKRLKKSTDVWIRPADWDAEKEMVLASNPNASFLNSKLSVIAGSIRSKLLKQDPPVRLSTVQEILGVKKKEELEKPESPDFIDYALKVNDLYYRTEKYGYTSWYNKKQNILAFDFFIVNFKRISRPKIDELRLELFDEYVQYRVHIKKNTSKEGINKTLVPLYSALDYAEKNGVVSKLVTAPIVGHFIVTRPTKYAPDEVKEDRVKYLTPEQMREFHAYCQDVKSSNARIILDMFFFSYFACGLRLSDVITLEWDNIDFEKRTLQKVQVKTKKKAQVEIPLSKNAMEILNRWKGYHLNGRFVFNRLPEDFDITNQHRLFMRRNAQDKGVNRVLATVGRNAKMPIPLTMHVARHSFAVMSINSGMSVYMLSKLLGHSSITATEKTYAQFLKEKVASDIQNLQDFGF